MRFLTSFPDERKAFACTNYFQEKEIAAIYEPVGEGEKTQFSIWIVDEDDYEKAQVALVEFEQLGSGEIFRFERPKTPPLSKIVSNDKESLRVQFEPDRPLRKGRYGLTYCLIILCGVLFFWNLVQETKLVQEEGAIALQLGLTPLQRDLFYDFPGCYTKLDAVLKENPVKSLQEIDQMPPDIRAKFQAAEQCPYWRGAFDLILEKFKTGKASFTSAPLFEKIGKGEIWRIFTPCLLHQGFLHILFNMAWLFLLGKMIEERIGKWRMLLLVVIIACISNTAQYLMSGPYFLGFSGVVCGMVGFIWMRQRLAPWEGYPLSGGTTLFLLIFVIAMVVLQFISLGLEFFGVQNLATVIANTAHIVGGLTGILLAYIPFLSRSPS
jgi:GlpG protein